MKVSLCSACESCPSVEINGDTVSIGEEDNMVHLTQAEWNALVTKVKTGELREI